MVVVISVSDELLMVIRLANSIFIHHYQRRLAQYNNASCFWIQDDNPLHYT